MKNDHINIFYHSKDETYPAMPGSPRLVTRATSCEQQSRVE